MTLSNCRRREEQIKIFESLGQDETLHFVELLFTDRVGERLYKLSVLAEEAVQP
jgi:hypothetical protein